MASEYVIRYDAGAVTRASRTDAGYLAAPATVARTGVLAYALPDGSVRRELRLAGEVFSPASIATLAMAPLTLDHPPTPTRLLDATTTKQYQVGHLGDSIRQVDGKYIEANALITDAAAIKAIEAGKCQLSAGYRTKLDFVSGVYDGVPYDAIQREIRYNHVAIVARGRAGPEVSLHLDSEGHETDEMPMSEVKQQTIKIDGVDFEMPEPAAQALARMQARMDSEAADLRAKLEATKAELAAAQDPAKVHEQVRQRVALETQAMQVLGREAKIDTLDDQQIRVAVVSKIHPSMAAKLQGASAEYIAAAYDFAVAGYSPAAKATADARAAGEAASRTDSKPTAEDMRRAFCLAQTDAWRKPLTPVKE